ncbi:MAG: HAD family phosphatase [Lewinellaceae bacterium]|nr:HAD family phosphatase [Saprospiraceae bacterium]MCB9331532.1 HAD family phosphatase [Lewinellaceae bacterium]
MQSIKNIIFDFGNVLFDLELGAISRELTQLTGTQFESIKNKLDRLGVFHLYETGGITTEEFVDTLCQAANPHLEPAQVIDAWNSILVGMPLERFDQVLRLRQHYQVFLLSNINDLHARWIDDYLWREHNLDNFQTRYFDAVYYSHLIRLRKPDREIYEYVLADAELVPEESVFIDDLEENIETARQLGIHTIHKTPDLDIMQLMDRLLAQKMTPTPG